MNLVANQTKYGWVDKASKFYNRSMKSWLEKNTIEMYSIHKTKENLLLLKDLLEP